MGGASNGIHTLSLVVRDKPGVLVRIALVFARRGYNIESCAVSPAARAGFARMTITSRGHTETREQINKQLAKLIDVVYVTDHRDDQPLQVEIALVKLRVNATTRADVLQVAEHYKANVIHFSADTLILRVHGTSDKLNNFIGLIEPYQVEELVRSGPIVMSRGPSQFAQLLGEDDRFPD